MFSFGGKIGRKHFALNFIFTNLLVCLVSYVSTFTALCTLYLLRMNAPGAGKTTIVVVVGVLTCINIILGFCNSFKRVRDITGKPVSFWFVFGNSIPIVSLFLLFWLLFTPSKLEEHNPSITPKKTKKKTPSTINSELDKLGRADQ